MKFSFDCIHLDSNYADLFYSCMINNKIISEYSKDARMTQDNFFEFKRRLIGIKKLLRYIVLFEKIDFLYAEPYDHSRVIELGLMDTDALAFARQAEDYGKLLKGLSPHESDLIFKLFRNEIIHEYKFRHSSDDSDPRYKKAVTLKKFNQYYDEYMDSGVFHTDGFYTFEQVMKHIFQQSLDRYHFDLSICLEPKNKRTYCSDIVVDHNQVQQMQVDPMKLLDDIYYIAKIRLPDEVNILPMPQTLNQAIEMRNSPYLKSFRNVMNEWMHYIDAGELLLSNKMKNDVIKANQNLTKLENYRKFQKSPFVRICNLVGGFIPLISNVLTVLSFASSLVEDSIEKRSEWALMPLAIDKKS